VRRTSTSAGCSLFRMASHKFSAASTIFLVTINYLLSILGPLLLLGVAFALLPLRYSLAAVATFVIGWIAKVATDRCEFKAGRPDPEFSKNHWLFVRLRDYFSLTLVRSCTCFCDQARGGSPHWRRSRRERSPMCRRSSGCVIHLV
jgi:hypothetical protein